MSGLRNAAGRFPNRPMKSGKIREEVTIMKFQAESVWNI